MGKQHHVFEFEFPSHCVKISLILLVSAKQQNTVATGSRSLT